MNGYRYWTHFVQDDQKVSVHLMITIHKVTSNVQSVPPASLQTFIDTPNCVLEDRVQYSTVHIPNVICDGHLHIVNCVGIKHFITYIYIYIYIYISVNTTI